MSVFIITSRDTAAYIGTLWTQRDGSDISRTSRHNFLASPKSVERSSSAVMHEAADPHHESTNDENTEGRSSGVITSGLLNLGTEQNKVDAIHATVNRGNNLDNDHVVNAPTLEATPIQEDAPGYIAQAFPTLFPNGAGDFHTPHMQKVDMGEYFDRLIRIHDGWFARHRRFPWFTFNTLQRRRSLGAAKVYVRQAHDAYGMTVAEIQNLVNEGDESIAQNTMDVQLSLRYSKILSTLLMVTPVRVLSVRNSLTKRMVHDVPRPGNNPSPTRHPSGSPQVLLHTSQPFQGWSLSRSRYNPK
ncbi:hypothetical protein EV360DRAFT_89120 [Lentinula raphanica]|nr:hypothetical protein EV360DRAFT_89120 [Lentinula raphanica]